MVKHLLLITLMVLLPVGSTQAADHIPGELLVMLDQNSPLRLATPSDLLNLDAELTTILQRHGLGTPSWVCHKSSMSDSDRLVVKLTSRRADLDLMAARNELAATGLFRAVSPNYLYSVLITPNDPMLGNQWHVTNATSGIKLPQAWDVTTGGSQVVIAILDTGLDWSHPDLAANAWHNPDEIAGNGVDDDGNGFIDDIYGWDCGQNDNDPRPAPYHEAGMDVGFHGTHCGGIASAVTNNGTGVAGAGWSCKLMGLKTTDGDTFSLSAITMGFNYAMEELPDVISMSFGGTGADFNFMQALIDDATAAGIICVAAAGNNDTAQVMYPAGLNHVISVGATNSANQRASFSTYGTWVDVAAPGEHIWSTIQSNYDFDLLTGLLYGLLYEWDGVNPYMYCDGTSMACPLVAGVCGLVRSVAPNMTPDQMEQHLMDTGDNVTYDQPIGVKVNAFNAVNEVTTSVPQGVTDRFRLAGNHPNPFNPSTEIEYSLHQSGPAVLTIHDPAGRLVRTLVQGTQSEGPHRVTWNGVDDGGNPLPSGIYFARLLAADRSDSRKLVLIK